MVWVNSEYAGEFAVVSAWLSALLPWYVGYGPDALAAVAAEEGSGAVLFLRWPFFQVRFIFGVPFADAVESTTVAGASGLYTSVGSVAPALYAWYVGAAAVGVAALLGAAMYHDEERVTSLLPVPSVRLVGALLAVAVACFALSTALFYTYDVFDAYPVPVGLLLLAALAWSLLRVDLVDPEGAGESDVEPSTAPE